MYIILYLTVAYYIIQAKDKERKFLRWITFIFVSSLALDELRQVCFFQGIIFILLLRANRNNMTNYYNVREAMKNCMVHSKSLSLCESPLKVEGVLRVFHSLMFRHSGRQAEFSIATESGGQTHGINWMFAQWSYITLQSVLILQIFQFRATFLPYSLSAGA